jgi:MFS family permease
MSVIWAAVLLAPQGLAILVARPLIGKFTDSWGARRVATLTMFLAALATLPFCWFNSSTPLWLICLTLFIRGLGTGGIILPLMADAYTGLDAKLTAQASVGSRIVQNLGGSFGTAALSGVLVFAASHTAASAPTGMAPAFHIAFAVVAAATLVMLIPTQFLTDKKH